MNQENNYLIKFKSNNQYLTLFKINIFNFQKNKSINHLILKTIKLKLKKKKRNKKN